MRVTELTAYRVRIPLKSTIRHASHTRRSTENLVVHCRLDCGVEGWGESVPRPYVTGESIETSLELLQTADIRPLVESSFQSLAEAVQIAGRLDFHPSAAESVSEKGDRHPTSRDRINWNAQYTGASSLFRIRPHQRDCFGNAARCAVELSLLDAAAKAGGVSLSHVTQLVPETIAIRKPQERVRYSAAVTSMSALKERIQAWKIRLYGFQQCKVKVGASRDENVATLQRIRRILGPRTDLRIDVNEAWQCEQVEEQLQPLLPMQISSVEQPVPHAQVDGLARLRDHLSVPIMLDESLGSIGDAHRAIERGTCDLFNIRLSKCGGFVNSLKIAALAHRAGLEYQLGCQVGETGVLSAAGRHFATSVANIRYLEGSYDRHLVRERLTVEDMTFGHGGVAPALAGPGLGVQVDRNALARCTTYQKTLWS